MTQLKNGVALAFAQSHAAGDCRSMLQFVQDLSRVYRGEEIKTKPSFERDVDSWINPNKEEVANQLRQIPGYLFF